MQLSAWCIQSIRIIPCFLPEVWNFNLGANRTFRWTHFTTKTDTEMSAIECFWARLVTRFPIAKFLTRMPALYVWAFPFAVFLLIIIDFNLFLLYNKRRIISECYQTNGTIISTGLCALLMKASVIARFLAWRTHLGAFVFTSIAI